MKPHNIYVLYWMIFIRSSLSTKGFSLKYLVKCFHSEHWKTWKSIFTYHAAFYMLIIYEYEPFLFFQTAEISCFKPLNKNKAPPPNKAILLFLQKKKENCCKMHSTIKNFTAIPFLCFFLEKYWNLKESRKYCAILTFM